MRLARMTFAVAAVLLIAQSARAQYVSQAEEAKPGFISAGGFVGPEFDLSDNWLVVGADARVGLTKPAIELNPRFSFRSLEDGSATQIDVNVLKNFELARQGRLHPFIGVGAALARVSFDDAGSETDIGLNLVSGARLAMRSGALYEPFIQAQYTTIKDRPDAFTIVVGASFSLH